MLSFMTNTQAQTCQRSSVNQTNVGPFGGGNIESAKQDRVVGFS